MNTPQLEVSVPFFRRRWVKPLLIVLMLVIGMVTWLGAQSLQGGRIGPNSAAPNFIVVKTPTAVTFTSVITDSNLRKHDPLRVLLIRTDASGNPIDIVGRMLDNGKKADATRKDRTYTTRVTLNEGTVGPIYFKIAARFNGGKDDDDWDRDLGSLNDFRNRGRRLSQLSLLLRRLQKYELSDAVVVAVDPVLLPPDPGEAGKQTLEGIDSDHDGIRDDVQRWVAVNYGAISAQRTALTQHARSHQRYISSIAESTTNADDVLALVKANTCLSFIFGPTSGTKEAIRLVEVNTQSRLDADLVTWRFAESLPRSGAKQSDWGLSCE